MSSLSVTVLCGAGLSDSCAQARRGDRPAARGDLFGETPMYLGTTCIGTPKGRAGPNGKARPTMPPFHPRWQPIGKYDLYDNCSKSPDRTTASLMIRLTKAKAMDGAAVSQNCSAALGDYQDRARFL